MTIILAIVGIVAAWWIVNTLINKGTNAASRAVFSKKYEAGRAEMHRGLQFRSPASTQALSEAIVSAVNAHASAPAVAGGLYLAQRTDQLLVFAFGSKAGGDTFRARVDLSSTETGSQGSFRLHDWKESGASVLGRERIEPLVQRISSAVTGLGGTVTEVSHA